MHSQNTTITLPNGKQVHRLKNDGRITVYEHGPHRLKTQVALSPKQLEEWIHKLENQ